MRKILFTLPLLFTLAIADETPGGWGVVCGTPGPYHSVTGQEFIIGVFDTQAAAHAAALNNSWLDEKFLEIGWSLATEDCEPCPDNDGCWKSLEFNESSSYAAAIGPLPSGEWAATIQFDQDQGFWIFCFDCFRD